jgi:hypothetical protein
MELRGEFWGLVVKDDGALLAKRRLRTFGAWNDFSWHLASLFASFAQQNTLKSKQDRKT